ncbi:hypothetical protein NX059_006616 [Plenodomus lindquistii]|nr:hypothetical protein NX059_006616 [Plenodomus lindquistii]
MRLSTIITYLLVSSIAVLCTPITSALVSRGDAGSVTDVSGKRYALYNTGDNGIRIITNEINGDFMKPIGYSISANHTCKFWSEATRGVGYLIGEFTGPVQSKFGAADWAAFFECWDPSKRTKAARSLLAVHGPVGNVVDVNGAVMMLQVKDDISILGKKGDYYHPKGLNIAEGYQCEFYIDYSIGERAQAGKWQGPADYTFGDVFDDDARSTALYKCFEISEESRSLQMARKASSIGNRTAGEVMSVEGETFKFKISNSLEDVAIVGGNKTGFTPGKYVIKVLHQCQMWFQPVGQAVVYYNTFYGPYKDDFKFLFDNFANPTIFYGCIDISKGPSGMAFDAGHGMFPLVSQDDYAPLARNGTDFKPDHAFVDEGYTCDFACKDADSSYMDVMASIQGQSNQPIAWDSDHAGWYKCRATNTD